MTIVPNGPGIQVNGLALPNLNSGFELYISIPCDGLCGNYNYNATYSLALSRRTIFRKSKFTSS